MMPSDEKASAFLEAINKYAEQQRNEIHAEVEQFKEEELKKAEIEVLTDAYTLIQKDGSDAERGRHGNFPRGNGRQKKAVSAAPADYPGGI